MQSAPLPTALVDLRHVMGTEIALDSFHGLVRRAAQSVRSVRDYGTALVTCSDELNGEVRDGFDRDVARPLMAARAARNHRTFTQANLGGRVEPGMLNLVTDHFTFRERGSAPGERLLLVEVVSHVGRRHDGHRTIHGECERFGRHSVSCGALAKLLAPPAVAGAVHFPWLEHLEAFFGAARLAELRAMDPSLRLAPAALIHAALQAESLVTDALRSEPPPGTWLLVVAAMSVNQSGVDGAVPVGYHLLHAEGRRVSIEGGFGLRTTPSALSVVTDSGRIHVDAGAMMEDAPSDARVESLDRELLGEVEAYEPRAAPDLAPEQREEVRARMDETRAQAERLRADPVAWRVYARPLLRSLFQGLTVVAPEVGLAAMMLESGADWVHARHRKQLLETGPSSPEARRILRDVESSIQQLSHREAQEVLDILIAEGSPLG